MKDKKLTMSDIAKMAGVGKSTVSRYFNGGYIKEETRLKLKKVIDENNYIRADFDKITMILKNLIENGIIYNKSENPKIIVKITEGQDRYNFSVSDNGIGIPADEQYKVFERFYRVDRARTSNLGGTGLGLAIVKSLIEKYGGKITVVSEEGKGTTFEFYISK